MSLRRARGVVVAVIGFLGTGASAAWAQDEPQPEQPVAAEQAKPAAQAPSPHPWDPIKSAKRAKQWERRDRFMPRQDAPLLRGEPLFGAPVLISPRAMAYIRALPEVQLGRDGVRGTKLRLDPLFGLENYEIAAPDLHLEMQTDLWGYLNEVRFSIFDSEFRGARSVRSAFQYDSTLFPQGAVVDARFGYQEVSLHVVQRVAVTAGLEWWVVLGGRHTRSQLSLHDPMGGRRESNRNDALFPVAGLRWSWTPAWWMSAFLETDGWSWSLDGTRMGSWRAEAGIEIRFGKGWGFVVGWGWSYLEVVHGGSNRDALRYVSYGPTLTLLAGL